MKLLVSLSSPAHRLSPAHPWAPELGELRSLQSRAAIPWGDRYWPKNDSQEDKLETFVALLLAAGFTRSKAKGSEYEFDYTKRGVVVHYSARAGNGRSAIISIDYPTKPRTSHSRVGRDKVDPEVEEALTKALIVLSPDGTFNALTEEDGAKFNLFVSLLKSVGFTRIHPQNSGPSEVYYVKGLTVVRTVMDSGNGLPTLTSVTAG